MSEKSGTKNKLLSEIEALRMRVADMEGTLNAIRNGEVDGLVASGPQGEEVYTLKSADYTYRRLIEEMNEGAAIMTLQGIILYCNSKLGNILHTPPEQIAGCSIYNFVAPSERTRCNAAIQKSSSGSAKEEITFGLKGEEGVPVYLSLKFLQLEDIQVICAVFTDLTEQKRQELIEVSEKLARSILEQTNAAIAVIDGNGQIIMASRAAHELSGHNCFMQSFDVAFPLRVHSNKYKRSRKKDDTVKHVSFINIVQKVRNECIEAELIRSDGRLFSLLVSIGFLLDEKNNKVGYVVTMIDLTKRKEAEEALLQSEGELRTHQIELEMQNEELRKAQEGLEASRSKYSELYNFAPVGYFTFDKNGLILDVNITGSSMLGVEKNILVKKPFSLFIARDSQDNFYLHRKIVFKNKECQTCDVKLIKKNGIQFDARFESVALPDNEGNINQLRTVISDITEYKRSQVLLQVQKDIALLLSNISSLKKTMQKMLSSLVQLNAIDCGSVHVMDERTGALDLIAHRGLSAQFIKSVSSYDASSPCAHAFMEGKPVYKAHSDFMTQTDAAHRREKLCALALIPMVYNNSVIALLSIGSHTNNDIPTGTRIALEAIASQTGSAIIRTKFNKELKKHKLQLENLVNKRTAELNKTNVRLQNKIIEHEHAENKLRIFHEQLRKLSQHVEKLREEERKRIARELHDELGQSLTALKLDLLLLSDDFHENEKLVARVSEMNSFINKTIIKSVQEIASQLRPAVLDELGLKAAIEWLTDEIKKRKNIVPQFITNFEELDISQDYSIALFRIVQEALTNVVRHAQASSIKIVLREIKNHLHLLIQDNGRGIDESIISDHKGLGLLGMRERAISMNGDLKIKSYPGKGTRITLSVPLKGDITT